MNPTLTTCLFGTILIAGSAAVLTLAAGGGWLAALAVYSLGGSLTLMTATLLAMPGDTPPVRPAALPPEAALPRLAQVLA